MLLISPPSPFMLSASMPLNQSLASTWDRLECSLGFFGSPYVANHSAVGPLLQPELVKKVKKKLKIIFVYLVGDLSILHGLYCHLCLFIRYHLCINSYWRIRFKVSMNYHYGHISCHVVSMLLMGWVLLSFHYLL